MIDDIAKKHSSTSSKKFKTPHKTNTSILKIKPYQKNAEKRKKMFDYYITGKKKKNGLRTYMDYILRDEANFTLNVSAEELDELLILKDSDIDKYEILKKEYEQRPETTGLWTKNGLADEEELKRYKESMKLIDGDKQHFWNTVISFEEIFADKHLINHPEKVYNILKYRINDIFKAKKLDPDKMEWSFSFHKNTDNPHIHLNFFEKEPKQNGKFEFKYNLFDDDRAKFVWNLSKDLIFQQRNFDIKNLNKDFRNVLVTKFEQDINPKNISQNSILKSNWTKTKEIYNDLVNNYNHILKTINENDHIKQMSKAKSRIYYNNLTDEQKQIVNQIVDEIIINTPEIKQAFDSYNEKLNIIQETYNELDVEHKAGDSAINNHIYGNDGLYARLGQKVLDSARRLQNVNDNWDKLGGAKISKIEHSEADSLKWAFIKFFNTMDKFLKPEVQKTQKILWQNRKKTERKKGK